LGIRQGSAEIGGNAKFEAVGHPFDGAMLGQEVERGYLVLEEIIGAKNVLEKVDHDLDICNLVVVFDQLSEQFFTKLWGIIIVCLRSKLFWSSHSQRVGSLQRRRGSGGGPACPA